MTPAFQEGLQRYFSAGQLDCLAQATAGIAGVGGIGSNCAILLARSGVGNLILVDHDHVDASNLNRQHYWPHQIGKAKVQALAEQLLTLNSALNLTVLQDRAENSGNLLNRASIWVEALDEAQMKRQFVEAALLAGKTVFAASGICGIGGEPLQKRKMGRLTVIGDFRTGTCQTHPYAPRVTQAAALMADCVLEYILTDGAACNDRSLTADTSGRG